MSRFQFVADHQDTFKVKRLCKGVEVGRSSFYAWGITTVAVLQSLAQARARWGDAHAETMWDAATIKVVLGGLAHAEDLLRISRLAGEIDEQTQTRTRGVNGKSVATSVRRLPALPVEKVRGLPVGRALVLARRAHPIEAAMTPHWLTSKSRQT